MKSWSITAKQKMTPSPSAFQGKDGHGWNTCAFHRCKYLRDSCPVCDAEVQLSQASSVSGDLSRKLEEANKCIEDLRARLNLLDAIRSIIPFLAGPDLGFLKVFLAYRRDYGDRVALMPDWGRQRVVQIYLMPPLGYEAVEEYRMDSMGGRSFVDLLGTAMHAYPHQEVAEMVATAVADVGQRRQ